MKLLIQDTLVRVFLYNEATKDGLEIELHDLKMTLKIIFGVFSKLQDTGSAFCLTIEPQKVVLDEFDMNALFSEYLVYFDFNTEYAALGGDGCDFSLEITNRKPV